MERLGDDALSDYYREAESWSDNRVREAGATRRLAVLGAAVAAAIASLEAVALVMLVPLKTVEPYTLLVDRQTGYVQALKPLERQTIAPDDALVRSFLAQYVIARESFDIDSLRESYRKVALWSADEARSRYLAAMQPNNPLGPLATLPRRTLIETEVRTISPLNADTVLVRFATIRSDPGGQPQEPQLWAAVIKFRFSASAMTAADRLINPLGFQVVRYHRDAEIPLPQTQSAPTPAERTPQARATPRPGYRQQ